MLSTNEIFLLMAYPYQHGYNCICIDFVINRWAPDWNTQNIDVCSRLTSSPYWPFMHSLHRGR